MGLRFNPSSNKYTDLIMEMVSKYALADWKQQQKKEVMLKNIEAFKKQGLFPEAGQPTGGAVSPFTRQPIPTMYPKGLDLETGMPQIGIRQPEDIRGLQFQQDIGRFKAARSEYATGAGMTKEKFTLMPREERASFIKNRLANFPGARGAMQELRPSLEGREFLQDVSGKYREARPRLETKTRETPTTQAIVDASGKVIGYRPTGAVFQSKQTKEQAEKEVQYDINLTNKVIGNIKTQEDLNELLKNKAAYKEAGVDIAAIIKSVYNKPVGQKNKSILQNLSKWLIGE